MNKPNCPNELHWLAFRYAAGELTTAEAEQFEARLADDQAAREELARTVKLTQLVAAAEAESGYLVSPAAASRSEWQTRLSWMAIGGLASVLVAVLWSGVLGPTWRTAQRSFNASSQQQLAFAWNETRSEMASRDLGLWQSPLAVDGEDDLASDMQPDDVAAEDAPPSWMTAAVFVSADVSAPAERTEN